ncbi:MAG: hypothetical protein PHR87_00480 [Sulfurospirillaceae bacterium]|nr:hypothetical protein [Sulfurospirillaceae bacterium]
MKRVLLTLTVSILTLTLFTTNLQASTVRGKIFYAKTLRVPCGFTGDVMGKKYTMREWRTLYETNKLNDAVKAICPKAPSIESDKDLLNLFHFLNSFASDSGNVPSC